MKLANTILSLAILFIMSQNAIGQNLSGAVLSDTGESIIDAYIYTSDGENHTHSDLRGWFTIKDVEAGDTIMVSYLGYKSKTYIIQEEDFDQTIKIMLEEGSLMIDQVDVSASAKSVSKISNIDLRTNPVQSSQDILQKVPGLIIAQHAGGGKAEQIFLRGFDIDHGTDIAIEVDGIPVNMVSHAHGQGYADLHFLIPETVQNIEFGKGPYYGDVGNFGTAGYVGFQTKEKLDQSTVGVEYGMFDTRRLYGLVDIWNDERTNGYIATEYLYSDGPFESSQNFNRVNVMGKVNHQLTDGSTIGVMASRFQSKWDASGQIPQRLVDNGTIGRFGAVDDTEGGNTSRTNLLINHMKNISDQTFLKTNLYYVDYDFELYSNFTFFLDNPAEGDQIKQQESRNIYGLNSTLYHTSYYDQFDLSHKIGIGMRYDEVEDNELSSTLNRSTLRERFAYGDVFETNLFAFASTEVDFGKLLIIPSLRADFYNFQYNDQLTPLYDPQSAKETFIAPKVNVIYNPTRKLQWFVKAGRGHHSNDSRVSVVGDLPTLPSALGIDLGTVVKPTPNLWLTAALWQLNLEQEFVYVGDAAIVEPSGRTTRRGVEVGARWQIMDQLFFYTDGTYTIARSVDEEEGNNFIPLAPDLTMVGGLSYRGDKLNMAVNYRYVDDRPANEDNSIVAEGFFVLDANANYQFKHFTLGVTVENALNTEWNQAQFATESRLQDEIAPVEEIHFTPGVPFFLKGSIAFNF